MNKLFEFLFRLLGVRDSTPATRIVTTPQASTANPLANSAVLGRKTPPTWYQQRVEQPFVFPEYVFCHAPEGLDSLIAKISDMVGDITPAPSASFKIYQRLHDDETPAKEIAEMASGDPVLAARILKCVNSAYFGLSGEVSSISQAILLLGMNQLRVLLLSEGLKVDFSGIDKEFQDKIALHSAVTSTIAFHLAKQYSGLDAGALRTVALVHDMGRILFRSNHSEQLRQVFPEEIHVEHKISIVGGAFANAWELPKDFCTLIQCMCFAQIYGLNEVPYGYRRQVALLSVAHYLARVYGFDDGEASEVLDPYVIELLELPIDPSQWLSPELAIEIQKTTQLF